MKINKSNYGFLLSDNKYVKYLLIDGYEVGGLGLDSISIRVALNNEKIAVAWFDDKEKEKYNINPDEYKRELNEAAELLKEAIERNSYSLFSIPYDDVYDKNDKKVEIINKQKLGDLEYIQMKEYIKNNTPVISRLYYINEKKPSKLRMTNFERTIESLNMINFIKDFSQLNIKVSLK